MIIKEYDSIKLIDFYSKNGLEISKEHSYLGTNLFSLIIEIDNKVIGAITISKYQNKDFLEAIAIDEKYRRKNLSNILLEEIYKLIDNEIYTISKLDTFYLKNGYIAIEDEFSMITNNCKLCEEYNKTCHPKVMLYKKAQK